MIHDGDILRDVDRSCVLLGAGDDSLGLRGRYVVSVDWEGADAIGVVRIALGHGVVEEGENGYEGKAEEVHLM